jgi:CubicO group peptidase (beta-lactamase class C family)/surface polysaccharide O-acyltransferase-like enzyme
VNTQSALPQRRYELDWLRVLAILAVFVYHCALIFAPDPFSIKNATTYQFIDDLGEFVGLWGMPLIFLISGASVFYALGKASPGKYFKGIALRLLVPLIVGIFTHIAFQVYVERLHTGTFGGSFFEFYPHYFDGMYGFGGNFAWMGLHLWYLQALFLFSLLFLPLFLWLKNSPTGRRALRGLGDSLARPGAAYLLALPAYVLINLLDPASWGTAVMGGWSLFIYMSFFVSGFVIISSERLQSSIKHWRWVSLGAGILLVPAVVVLWTALGEPGFGTSARALGIAPYCLSAWCWLLAILGFGMKHLSFNPPFLKHANEAVLPFYILHQSAIVSLGFFVVQWAIPDGLKFLAILIMSFLVSVGLYESLVRRNNLLRILFGMKPRPSRSTGVQAVPAGVATILRIAGLMVVLAAIAGCQLGGIAGVTVPAPSYWPTEGWQATTPESQGFDSARLAEGLRAIRQNDIRIHSLLIIRRGYVLADAYFYPYDGSTYHDMASATKSLMTTLIGIAADQRKLELDQPMLSFFPDRAIANRDERKERITVAHLASMSSGLECSEANGEETSRAMFASDDWVQFTLDLPMGWEPGTHFVYCSPAIHLLSAILQQATGMTALEFARANLFEPLGVHESDWPADPQGHNLGSGDVLLRPLDAAKLGFLWLHQGSWEDRQIVSPDWVTASVQRLMTETAGRPEDYGYGWWISDPEEQIPFFQAAGIGGQLIKVFPELDLMFVTTGGGFEVDEIDPYLIAAVGDLENPLPENPDGIAELEAALVEISQPPAASPVASLPDMAQTVSGRTYGFEADQAPVEWVRLEFGDPKEASLDISITGEDAPRRIAIGLDGVYRMAPDRNGLASGGRGYWADDHTFVAEYNRIADLDDYTLTMAFDGDRVQLEVSERVYGVGFSLDGVAQER